MPHIIISDTQQRIIDSFFILARDSNSLKKITMKDIAEKAGIKRQNIYKKHFSSKKDIINTIHNLINWECEQKFEEFINDKNQTDLISFYADNILPILYDKRDYLKILYGTDADSEWMFFLQKQYSPIVKECLKSHQENLGKQIEFISELIVRQFISVIANWLTSEQPEPPSLFKQILVTCLSTSTSELLNGKQYIPQN